VNPAVQEYGWPIGPFPLIAFAWGLWAFLKVVLGRRKLDRNNTVAPFALSPMIIVIAAALLGIRDRAQLSPRVEIWALVACGVLEFALLLVMHARSRVKLLGKWKAMDDHTVIELVFRLMAASMGFAVLVLLPNYLFPDASSDSTCTRLCISAAYLVGSNTHAAGLLWTSLTVFGLFVCMFIICSWELVKRAWRLMLRAIGSL